MLKYNHDLWVNQQRISNKLLFMLIAGELSPPKKEIILEEYITSDKANCS